MRIGVITHPLRLNYGGILQAYALQRVLQDMGHDTFYIDWMPYRFVPSVKVYFRRFLWKLKWLGRQEIKVFADYYYDRAYRKINKNCLQKARFRLSYLLHYLPRRCNRIRFLYGKNISGAPAFYLHRR